MTKAPVILWSCLAFSCTFATELIDFTKPNSWGFLRGKIKDPTEAAIQTRLRPEGTVFHLAAAKCAEPMFAEVGTALHLGAELVGTGRVVRLVTQQSDPTPLRHMPGLVLKDSSGEIYQYWASDSSRIGQTVSYVYSITEKGYVDVPWSGDGNRKWDPPMRICGFFLGYESPEAEGDVTLVKLETIDDGDKVCLVGPAVSCIPDKDVFTYIGGWVRYTSFPGPKPFMGARELQLVTEPAYGGNVRLRLKRLTTGETLEYNARWNDVARFETNLHPGELYEFIDLVFHSPGKDLTRKDKFIIKSFTGTFEQSLAGACRMDVDTGNPLHIITTNSKDAPKITLFNPSDRSLSWKGVISLCDLSGHTIKYTIDETVESCKTNVVKIGWPLPGKGLWRVHGDISGSDGSKAYPQTTFAVLDPHPVTPALGEGKFRMGINYHYGRFSAVDKQLTMDALVASGAKIARVGVGTRAGVESAGPRQYDWKSADEGVARFLANGIAIDTICWSTPQWAATEGNRTNRNWQVWYLRKPADMELASEYYEKLAARYGDKIAYYEIGNEWELSFPGGVDEAIEIQKMCYSALKRGNDKVTVIPNGWANWDSEHPQVKAEKKGFPEKVMQESKGFYDAHPIHNHGQFADYRRHILSRFLPRRKEMGINVPWYSNETALSGVHGNEIAVAEHVWKKIPFAWAYGSRDYIWYNLKATGWDPKDPEQGYGLITADYYPRASYAAFSALSTLLSGFDAETILKSEKTREVFRFRGVRNGKNELVVLGWDSSIAAPVAIEFMTDATLALAVDFMGNESVVAIDDGRCKWRLGARPTAIRFIGASFAEPNQVALSDIPDQISKPIIVGKGSASKRPPDLTINDGRYVHCFYDANPATVHRTWKGPADNSFQVWFGRQKDALAIQVVVTDDVHSQAASEARKMSEGDCIRIDLEIPGKAALLQLGFRMTEDGIGEPCVWAGPQGSCDAIKFTAKREGNLTTYRIVMPFVAFGIEERMLFDGDIKVAIKSDDSDGEGRDLWMGLESLRPLIFVK